MTGSILAIPLSTPPPRINMGIYKIGPTDSPLLPLSHGHSAYSSSPSRPIRSATRRISYNLKNRANKHAYMLSICGALALFFFFYTSTRSSSSAEFSAYSSRLTNNGKLHLYTRDRDDKGNNKQEAESDLHGLSLLLDEDELLSEDALRIASYEEPEESPIQEDDEEELRMQEEARQREVQYSLSALAWFLAEGGIIPQSWNVPSKETLMKIGGKGLERTLNQIDTGDNGEPIFQDGWRDYAMRQYRILVFSKSYCPFSKRAKTILSKYRLTPAPFIVELDHRSDMAHLQNLLQRLTGRRTVPNIILDFQSLGGADEIQMADGEGVLERKFQEMGVLPGFTRRFNPDMFDEFLTPPEPALPNHAIGENIKMKDVAHPPAAVEGVKVGHDERPVDQIAEIVKQQQAFAAANVPPLALEKGETTEKQVELKHEETEGHDEANENERVGNTKLGKEDSEELDRLRARLAELQALAEGRIEKVSEDTKVQVAEKVVVVEHNDLEEMEEKHEEKVEKTEEIKPVVEAKQNVEELKARAEEVKAERLARENAQKAKTEGPNAKPISPPRGRRRGRVVG